MTAQGPDPARGCMVALVLALPLFLLLVWLFRQVLG